MMIPQRTLRNDFAASELKERVTACRKRLRARRFLRQPVIGREFDEDSYAAKVPFLDDESPMRESFLRTELSSAALDGGNDAHEMLLTLATQEAGIT